MCTPAYKKLLCKIQCRLGELGIKQDPFTVPKNDPKVEVCVNEQPTIPGHVHTLRGSENTFHKIFTHIGGPKKPKKPRNFLENWVLFTIVANGFGGES